MQRLLFIIVFLVLLSPRLHAELLKRDLLVELRHINEIAAPAQKPAAGYRAGAAAQSEVNRTQSVLVRNGGQGSLRWSNAVPVQWQQSVQSHTSHVAGAAGSTRSSGGGATQGLHWFDVGQSITVRPKWPGGKKAVALEIEVLQADMKVEHNADLPRQTRNQFSTSVTVPLNTWVTIATSAKAAAAAGSYSSEAGAQTPHVLQIRVLAP